VSFVSRGAPAGAAIAGGLAGLVIGVVGVIAILAFALTRIGDPIPPRPSVDKITSLATDAVIGGLYAEVTFADKTAFWVGTTDGGSTWARVDRPGHRSQQYQTSPLHCAADDVCYLAHRKTVDKGAGAYLIDRIDPDRTWQNEATFGAECAVGDLVVDTNDSDWAMAQCDTTHVALRRARGSWAIRDLIQLASPMR
jgi:hypothetical protein